MAKLTITKDWAPISETITFGSKEEAVKALMDAPFIVDSTDWDFLARQNLADDAFSKFDDEQSGYWGRWYNGLLSDYEYHQFQAKAYVEHLWDQEAR